ncbi:cell wall hydrolase, partial [Methylobacterium trifolii]
MRGIPVMRAIGGLGLIAVGTALSACNSQPNALVTTGSVTRKAPVAATEAERDCLGRAMYFESNRTDTEGLLAVGTVVMNRVEAAVFPGGICAVVGQPNQFAAGVLTKPMRDKDLPKVADVADAILAGERHPQVGKAMHFHTAGRHYPYKNMHYVAYAGGNAFYEKTRRGAPTTPAAVQAASAEALSYAAVEPE